MRMLSCIVLCGALLVVGAINVTNTDELQYDVHGRHLLGAQCGAGLSSVNGQKCDGITWKYMPGFSKCVGKHGGDRLSSWIIANWLCEVEGGQLMMPANNAENEVFLAYLKSIKQDQNHWLLSRKIWQSSGWDSGNYASAYKKGTYPWDSGEPNNNREYCLQMRNNKGRWNDENCKNRMRWQCVRNFDC